MEERQRSTTTWTALGRAALFGAAGTVLVLGACAGGGTSGFSVTEVATAPLGAVIPGTSATEANEFQGGLVSFTKTEGADDGLGPVFNASSCAKCHSAGAVGGAGDDLSVAIVHRIGGYKGGVYSDLPELGGPVIQSHSLRDLDPTFPVAAETVPAGAQFVSARLTTPLFGAGLIEAIPADQILSRSGKDQGMGIRGHANMVTNLINGQTEVGRFGWKAQLSDLTVFAGDAYLNEMGVTNDVFGTENLPQGQPIPASVDLGAQPNDTDHDLTGLASFMRMLAPPDTSTAVFREALGAEKFQSTGCAKCHVPAMVSGPSSTPALAYKTVRLYSDLLVHDMGTKLRDGIVQGQAMGGEFRTAPLWGLSKRRFFLHNGSASTVEDAVSAHGGEAQQVRDAFFALPNSDRDALVRFVKAL